MWWFGRGALMGCSQLRSFERGVVEGEFPTNRVWGSCVPSKVAFLEWTETRYKCLMLGYLKNRGWVIRYWCCMCKMKEEKKSLFPSLFDGGGALR